MGSELVYWIATGLGLGLAPLLPGTAGALLGAPIAYYASRLSVLKQLAIAVTLALVAVPICHWAAGEFETTDDSRIVADEFLAFPIATLGLPCAKHPALLAVAFVTSRILDNVKPPPAAQADHVPGGVGIVLDDATANLYTLGIGWSLYAGFSYRARRRRQAGTEKAR